MTSWEGDHGDTEISGLHIGKRAGNEFFLDRCERVLVYHTAMNLMAIHLDY